MTVPILATKLYQPKSKANWVQRYRLIEKMNEGLERKFTLVSAPAGFGKTRSAFGGGEGEDHFSSFLVAEHAKKLVDNGGIGLSEHIFNALKDQAHER